MTPAQTLDWLADQHFDQCKEVRPVQDWIRKMKSQLPAPVQEPVNLHQALTDPENQPNQYGVEFGMHGEKMKFKVGVQQFTLDYEPDTQDEFNFMRDMLIHAFSTFAPDVETVPPAAQRQWVGLTDEEIDEVLGGDIQDEPSGLLDFVRAIEAKLKEKNT